MYQDIFEISLDKVTDLGYFIELEIKDDSLSVYDANTKLKDLVTSFDLSLTSRNLEGYATMLYQKLYGKKN